MATLKNCKIVELIENTVDEYSSGKFAVTEDMFNIIVHNMHLGGFKRYDIDLYEEGIEISLADLAYGHLALNTFNSHVFLTEF